MKVSQVSSVARCGCFGLIAATLISSALPTNAQYKAPSQYFRKDSPGVNRSGRPSSYTHPDPPVSPKAPAAPSRPAATEKPKFKDVSINTQFYFANDTNRAFPWTKVTATTAKNAKGVTQPIKGETAIQR